MRHRSGRLVRLAALVTAVATVGSGCTVAVSGQPKAARVVERDTTSTGVIRGSDGGQIDQLAGTALADIDRFWDEAFPATFGKPWTPLSGGIFSVDTADASAKPPPCTEKASDVEGNAFYCPSADAVAYDRAALLPVLQDKFGDAAVVIVLAHEMGHAVQKRMGITPESERANPGKFPTILTEAMADCFAGSFTKWVADGKSKSLDIGQDALDSALGALITFRDPVGTSPTDQQAHGNAFDRVSAFQDGFQKDAKFCGAMTVQNRVFTQSTFTNVADRDRGGNLPFDDMIVQLTPDLSAYYQGVLTSIGKTWVPPKSTKVGQEPDCSGDQGPVAFCKDDKAVEIDVEGDLRKLHEQIGDYATGLLMASRYGLSALAQAGKQTDGAAAGSNALCMAGAYTGVVLDRKEGFGLSPGDMDEAVQVLLAANFPTRDAKGRSGLEPGFKRVEVFRAGVFDGDKACGIR
ncbi:neutral zinc metallopeptidase [Umezawaea endophytica]|uniref:Neutral zinc metallopeptidase n=1 Tax=Umezawaea endophytica TaxID=1654476 RepID=A0A9X3A1V5_9PSEU|nr:neutral zinc metallopeptidase [Umezawaea endophytica]MCS7480074.1 neutral zinc metallopeptidase [Umezawaea endophytica]